MEWVWLFIALLSLIAGIHAFLNHEIKHGVVFLIMMIISMAMFYLRRHLRMQQKHKEL